MAADTNTVINRRLRQPYLRPHRNLISGGDLGTAGACSTGAPEKREWYFLFRQHRLPEGWLDEAMQNYSLACQMDPGTWSTARPWPLDAAGGRAYRPTDTAEDGRPGLLHQPAVPELPVRRALLRWPLFTTSRRTAWLRDPGSGEPGRALASLYGSSGRIGLTGAAGLFPVAAVLAAGPGKQAICAGPHPPSLGLFLLPDKFALLYLIFAGLYPVISKTTSRPAAPCPWSGYCKLACFNGPVPLHGSRCGALFLPDPPVWLGEGPGCPLSGGESDLRPL